MNANDFFIIATVLLVLFIASTAYGIHLENTHDPNDRFVKVFGETFRAISTIVIWVGFLGGAIVCYIVWYLKRLNV